MKSTLLCLLLMMAPGTYAQSNLWENPSVVDEGKEPPRADFVPYETEKQVVENVKWNSPYVKSLNGMYKFHFSQNVSQRPIRFYEEDLDDSRWKTIRVPGNWELQGFGIPVYTNNKYIFSRNPPLVDNDDLPIGSYRYWFDFPEAFAGRETYLYFGSIAGAATIYVNGKRVGYSKASKTAAEFNISKYLKQGKNLLAVQVFKWSDASYIEDQDFWRLAGIERDVMLISRPKISIEDFFVVGDLDHSYKNGLFTADVMIRNLDVVQKDKYTVELVLLDENQKKIYTGKSSLNTLLADERKTLTFSSVIKDPLKWSAEQPNLYTTCITLKDIHGKTIEKVGCKTGFRKIEIKNGQLMINGRVMIVKGVNVHEHHPVTGHYVDEQTKLKDICLWKQYNINAIRTSHYPQSPEVYQLCDKYGIYVVDEANIEAHGLDRFDRERHPSFLSEWKGQHIDRTLRVFERDKNHPSVIIWSLGNESDFGPNYETTYRLLKERDKAKRPVQFERSFENEFTDIVAPMYHFPERIAQYASREDITRPLILCEYSHSMGNSTGGFQTYWDTIMAYPALQGGFIWDWVDQGIETIDEQGRKYYVYGGDLGGHHWTHDENFCANGLISADRTIHPALHEVKKVYQDIWMEAKDIEAGKVVMHNHALFTDLNAYNYRWKLFRNGELVDSKPFFVSCKPGMSTDVSLKLPPRKYEGNVEYFLTVEALLKEDTPLLQAGYVIASEQFPFPLNNYFVDRITHGNLKIEKQDNYVIFESGDIQGRIRLNEGLIVDYRYKGLPVLIDSPVPNFWRAPTDNDFGARAPFICNVWRTAGDERQLKRVEVAEQTPEGLGIVATFVLKYINVPYQISYLIRNDGSIMVKSRIKLENKELPEMLRFGMKMRLPKYENVWYYGRGPWENYSDRNSASFIGNYKCKVNDLKFDYIRPQENGYRTDVRFAEFTNDSGQGVRFEAVNMPFCFNARYNADEDMDPGLTKKQQHPVDVDSRGELYVNIDYGQKGLGGNNSWGAQPLEKYRLKDKTYEYLYVIRPVENRK